MVIWSHLWASQVVQLLKYPPANVADPRDTDLIPGLGRSPGGGHGNPLQYSHLENRMARGPCRATGHRIAKSQTRLKQLSTHMHATRRVLTGLNVLCVVGMGETYERIVKKEMN